MNAQNHVSCYVPFFLQFVAKLPFAEASESLFCFWGQSPESPALSPYSPHCQHRSPSSPGPGAGRAGGRLVTAAVLTPSLEIGVPVHMHQLLMMWQSQTLPSLRPHCLIQKIQEFGPHNLLAIIF